MAGAGVPAVVHPWLGSLYWHGQLELIGSIDIDPAVRQPRCSGGRDAEILMEVPTTALGPSLQAHVEGCAARVKEALTDLLSIRRYAIEAAPRDLIDYILTQPGGPLIDRLFLDGIEVDPQRRVSVVFDFGDLDQLVVQLSDQGHGDSVFVRP